LKPISRLIADAVKSGRLSATKRADYGIGRTELSLVCVGTPSQTNGSLDTRYVSRVCAEIGAELARLKRRHTVVIRSTLLPGSMRDIVLPALEAASGLSAGTDFGLCNNPEFLREGTAVYDYDNPPKTVIGEIDRASGDQLMSLISTWLHRLSAHVDDRNGQGTSTTCGMHLKSALPMKLATSPRMLG
jgi:GDP-mannose 6-dehydrogenase